MRRVTLWIGVLGFIATSEGNSQSLKGSRAQCPVGSSECTGSYFDFVLASSGELPFDMFMQSFTGSRRRSKNRVLNVSTPRSFPASQIESGSSGNLNDDEATNRRSDVSSSESEDTESSERSDRKLKLVRHGWDWLEHIASLNNWQQFDFADGHFEHNARRSNRSDDAKEHRPSHGNDGRGNNDAQSPDKPDFRNGGLEASLTPEPSTLLLIGTGLPLAVAFLRRRRR